MLELVENVKISININSIRGVILSISLGIDVGSTTVKVVLIEDGVVLFSHYERHLSMINEKTAEVVKRAASYIGDKRFSVALSGSAGIGIAQRADLPFVQEVFATGESVKNSGEACDVVIELGGEDAKILFLTGGTEERMNGSCAGGTGAFIDQMATLMDLSLEELDALSLQAEKIYPIASHCGVFAKSDIQPLLNQNAKKSDLALSIFQAVVDQTIIGLAQGRKISGHVMFLGGPLYFFEGLKQRFKETLGLDDEHAHFPDDARFSVAHGAALLAVREKKTYTIDEFINLLENESTKEICLTNTLPPLFESEEEYNIFKARHDKASVNRISPGNYEGKAYLGIDCGSTTIKLVLISENSDILYEYYGANNGNPTKVVLSELLNIYSLLGDKIKIAGAASTGYGEELIKNAFSLDLGLVETMAHFKATRHFCPDVDFILDIGGQDIKCFKVKNNTIDNIMLNEACSSGCGSFLSTFAKSLGFTIEEFSKVGLFSKHPVDLGSRCTVFMNSSVKQAQKEGAGVDDISAGLAISVVKNAIYKVIRARKAAELGKHIVVQGGTFYNDAVLRSFERELGACVIRPAIAGLMGAFGAALSAKALRKEESSIISREEAQNFTHSTKTVNCGLCTNKCNLTVNMFAGGKKYISGNKCERPTNSKNTGTLPNLYEYKRKRIESLESKNGPRGKIGIPLGLNMYENIPFWHTFFTELGFNVTISGPSSVDIYKMGRYSIPSDTVCYPGKLMHGHIEVLLNQGIDTIFYPCMTYNFNEKKGDNHFNCPVVAYYPELLYANNEKLRSVRFLYPYVGIHRPKDFTKKIYKYLKNEYPDIEFKEVKNASLKAYDMYHKWQDDLKSECLYAIKYARTNGLRMIVLSGRPYHIDSEINHGIDNLITSLGLVVLSEDAVASFVSPQKVNVLNQWTYHSRLYNAAKYCTLNDDTELIQLVSFGCGIDAITTDEVRDILERNNKFYTQLKIDDISNLGAVKIRIRSLLGAIDEKERKEAKTDVKKRDKRLSSLYKGYEKNSHNLDA